MVKWSCCRDFFSSCHHSGWKSPKKSHFQKITKFDHFWHFSSTFVHSKCKCSSLRSQCWMRLFLWFSTTVHTINGDNKWGRGVPWKMTLGVEKKPRGKVCKIGFLSFSCMIFLVWMKIFLLFLKIEKINISKIYWKLIEGC